MGGWWVQHEFLGRIHVAVEPTLSAAMDTAQRLAGLGYGPTVAYPVEEW